MNRSKDLRDLFRSSLMNKEKRSRSSYVGSPYYNNGGNNSSVLNNVHRIPSQYSDGNLNIYFYEWSNPNSCPRTFHRIESFESFLRMSSINLEYYQKDIIKNLGTAYITCYTGTKNLNIRGTYKHLVDELREQDAKMLIPKIRTSSFNLEPQGRWQESDGTFFG